jgi:hypothetical protein
MTNPKDAIEMLKNFAASIEQQFQPPAVEGMSLKQALVEIKGIDRRTELAIEIDNELNKVRFVLKDKRSWNTIAEGKTLDAVVAKMRDEKLPGVTPQVLAEQMGELEAAPF